MNVLMTPQEAIVILNCLCQGMTELSTLEAITMGIKSLEKKILKKVIEQTKEDREFIDYVCPCCKTTLQQCIKPERRLRFHGGTIYKYKHCLYCGQALDWSDTE